jgi:hypothetical protein
MVIGGRRGAAASRASAHRRTISAKHRLSGMDIGPAMRCAAAIQHNNVSSLWLT